MFRLVVTISCLGVLVKGFLLFPCTVLGVSEQISYDADANGISETWEYYEDGKIIRIELDLDQDNLIDIYKYFRDNHLVRIESRYRHGLQNPEGEMNWWKYLQNDLPVLEKRDRNDDGEVDWVLYYKDGMRSKLDLDTDFDGRMDRWEYFTEDLVTRSEIDHDGDGRPDKISTARMTGFTGKVIFETQPAGATVIIDKDPHGETPLSITLPAGTHTIYLQLPGYKVKSFFMRFMTGKTYVFQYRLKKGRTRTRRTSKR